VKKNGRLPVLYKRTKAEQVLASWRHFQYKRLKKGELSPERANFFTELTSDKWSKDIQWNKMFESLKIFINKHNRLPKERSDNFQERALGKWRHNQIKYIKQGILSEERKRRIQPIALLFQISIFDISWSEKFNELKKFLKEYKRLPALHTPKRSERSLARWLVNQRRKKRASRLSNEKSQLLKSLSIPKDRFEERWHKRYKEIKIFVSKNVKQPSLNMKKCDHERRLGKWFTFQRIKYRKNLLTQVELNLLSKIKGILV